MASNARGVDKNRDSLRMFRFQFRRSTMEEFIALRVDMCNRLGTIPACDGQTDRHLATA